MDENNPKNNSSFVGIIIVLLVLIVGSVYFYSSRGNPPAQVSTNPIEVQSQVTFPTGADMLTQGQIYILTWNKTDPTSTSTHIFLIDTSLISQGESVSIVDRKYNVPDNGSYNYMIPMALPDGVYQFEIGTETSDTFQIATPATD